MRFVRRPRDQYNLRATIASRVVHKCMCANDSKECREELKACDKQWLSLMRETRELRKSLDLTHFLLGSLDRMSCLLEPTKSCQGPVITLSPLCYSKESQSRLKILEREQMEIERTLSYVTAQNDFLTYLLRRINSTILTASNTMLVAQDGPKDPVERPFYRYHRPAWHRRPSASVQKPHLGILSPSWTKGPSADAEIKREHVVNHLTDSDISSPPFISISESPGRIYKLIMSDKQRTADSAIILVISRIKLKTMGVHFQRSTDLVHEFGMETYCSKRPNGVRYATESHWMAYRWIPAECIVAEISVECFEAFCAARGVTAQDSGLYTFSFRMFLRHRLKFLLQQAPVLLTTKSDRRWTMS